MTLIKRLASISAVAFSMAACSTYDPATRGAPLEVVDLQPEQPSFNVAELRVAVPKALSVSEANLYYPIADIVWRGDPMGDRHKQVLDIFATSAQSAKANMDGAQPVSVEIEVVRFHSVTEKARYSVGGVHSIKFDLTVRDAESGEVLIPTRQVNADLTALGGRDAMQADNDGVTQKSRITEHLASVIEQELSRPLVAEDTI